MNTPTETLEEMTPTEATRFELVSHWHLAAPIDAVWQALKAAEQWPRWWRYVKSVKELRAGDADGLGTIRHFQWSSRLPYGVAFDVEVVEMRPHRLMRGRARGQLDGEGLWELTPDGDTTRVRYTWCVDLKDRWMRRVAPLAAPVFRWNHNGVMRAGAQGLARHLGVRLIDAC
jgi:uncharacterized protein YndB with AHSA1/START domain